MTVVDNARPGDLIKVFSPYLGTSIARIRTYVRQDVSSEFLADFVHGEVALVLATGRHVTRLKTFSRDMLFIVTKAGMGWCFAAHVTVVT